MPKTIQNMGTEGKTHSAGVGAILLAALLIWQTTPADQLTVQSFSPVLAMAIPYVTGIWAARKRSTVQMTNDQLILIFQMAEERGLDCAALHEKVEMVCDQPLSRLRRAQATQFISYLSKRVPRLDREGRTEDERPTQPLNG